MKSKHLQLIMLVAYVTVPACLLAMPVKLHRLTIRPGIDPYKLAADKKWPVYFIFNNVILTSEDVSAGSINNPIFSSEFVYEGDTKNLKWVSKKRGMAGEITFGKIIFEANGIHLVEGIEVEALLLYKKAHSSIKINQFEDQPIKLSTNNTIIDPNLGKDAFIAALTDQIDTAKVRMDLEALQAFSTRYVKASNHAAVAEWIRQEFMNMGIGEVQVDTFTFTPWWGGDLITCYNVIATIPGSLDTSITYIVNGHYDSVVDLAFPPDLPSIYIAAGADDNASGTAAVLEMARVLSVNRPLYSVKFLALDAEEEGGIGGDMFIERIKLQGLNVGFAMNYDMIGSYQDEYGFTNDSMFVSKLYPGSENYAYLLGKMASFYGRLADTNLVAAYTSDDLNSSDSWAFYQNGYNVTYSEEYRFSDNWHMLSDSITHMNIRYCTSIIKAGLGMLASFANYPRMVEDITVSCLSDDDKIYVQWKANKGPNIICYNVKWGTVSGEYFGNQYVSSLNTTISNLSGGPYYISIRAVDDLGRQSIESQEIEVQKPNINTILIVDNDGDAIDASEESWTKYIETAIANLGYRYSTVTINKDYATLLGYYNKYQLVIWNLGPNYDERIDATYKAISETDIISLMDYLNCGGKLWMIGQRYLWVSNPDTSKHPNLWSDYLHLSPVNGWINKPCSTIFGVGGGPVGGSFSDSLCKNYYRLSNNYGIYCSDGCQLTPNTAETTAVGFITDDNGGNAGIISQSDTAGGYKFVYTAFPFEAITNAELRDTFAARLIRWFMPQKPDYLSPEIPEGLMAVQQDSQIVCAWHANNEADLAGYNIYRALLDGLPQWYKVARIAVPETVYADKTVKADSTYCYAITAFDSSYPSNESIKSGYIVVPITALGVITTSGILQFNEFYLCQSKPNPFTRSTIINYQLPKGGMVRLNVYNISGQLIKTLVNTVQYTGVHMIKWDGRDEAGKNVSNGVYLYRLQAGNLSQTRKMIVLR